jgi:paraquat-inducible protein B
MSQKANPKLIGVFVLGAIAIMVAAVIIFGSGRFFTKNETFVVFFEDDVAGLNVGAPVTFRGVRIGSVSNIYIKYDSATGKAQIPVYLTVQTSKIVVVGERDTPEALIQKGLRAQLRTQSFVTGLLSVNLDFDPSTPPHLVGGDPHYTEIPSVRSSIAELRSTVSDLVGDFRRLPLPEMVANLTESAKNLNKLVGDTDMLVSGMNGKLPQVLENIDQAAQSVTKLTRDVDTGVPQIRDGAVEAVKSLNETLVQVQQAVGGIQSAVGDRSPLQAQMSRTLSDVGDAATAIRALAEYLNQNPRALLSGRGKDTDDNANK